MRWRRRRSSNRPVPCNACRAVRSRYNPSRLPAGTLPPCRRGGSTAPGCRYPSDRTDRRTAADSATDRRSWCPDTAGSPSTGCSSTCRGRGRTRIRSFPSSNRSRHPGRRRIRRGTAPWYRSRPSSPVRDTRSTPAAVHSRTCRGRRADIVIPGAPSPDSRRRIPSEPWVRNDTAWSWTSCCSWS